MTRYKPFHFCFLMFLLFLATCTSVEETPQGKTDLVVAPIEITSVEEEAIEPWQIIKQLDLDFEPTYVAFMDENVGVTDCGIKDDGPSFTGNGGETWIQPDPKHYYPSSVEIVNPQSVFMCHIDTGFRSSKDGGKTLEYLTLPVGGDCELLSFLDEKIGWSATRTILSVTTDGANSWTEISLPEEVNRIAAISLRTPETGYLLDFDGTLYQTQDGGSSWSTQKLETGSDELEIMSFGRPSAAIRFSDENNGLVVLNLAGGGESEAVALHTTDGGETWDRYVLPVKMGPVYLSHDGQYLTIMDMLSRGKMTLLKRS